MSEKRPENFSNKTRADLNRTFIVMNTRKIDISLTGKKTLSCHIERRERSFGDKLIYG